MEISYIVGIITVIVTLIAGEITKKYPNIDKKKIIPVQNIIIGILVAVAYYTMTKDFNLALAGSGLFAGGIYDLLSNLKNLKGEEE